MASGTDVARAAKAAGFPDSELVTAVAIAWAESTFNTNAVRHEPNGSTSYGAWQINSSHNFPELANGSWSNLGTNAKLAYAVWKAQGWNAWSTHKPSDPLGYARYLAAIPAAETFVLLGTGVKAGAAGAGGLLTDPGESAAGAAQDALGGVYAIAKEPLSVLKWFEQPESWYRIARFAVGSALLIGGVYLLVTSAIAKPIVAVVAKPVKAAGKVAR